MKFSKHNLIFVFVFFFFSISKAYILPLNTVLDKISKKTGAGSYEVNLEVTLQEGDLSPMTFNEIWIIEGAQKQRVTAQLSFVGSGPVSGSVDYYYEGNKRFFQKEGKLFSQKINDKYIMPLLFDSRSESLLERFKKLTVKNPGSIVRLGRWSGVPHLIYGEESKLWVEQDQNLIRKLDFSPQAWVQFNEYSEFRKSLHFPKQIQYSWEGGEARLQAIKVSSISVAQSKKLLNLNGLVQNDLEKTENTNLENSAPERMAQIKRFYSQFR
ncbi:MAG TPA: hypothetical protein PLJ21_05515 [Pseudobdellovibrionaceae bacterium]|nr:hypothetical protein [Pseudobdellovibrionaceae bacterium]